MEREQTDFVILYKQMHFSHLHMNLKYKMIETTYKWNGFQQTALKVPSFWVSTEDRSRLGAISKNNLKP